MLAALAPKLASLAVQPAVLAAGVATGVAVGAVGVGTGAIPVADPKPHNAPLYECPDSTRVVTSVAPNQNVLVTARSADGRWLQIYVGEAGTESGWAPASALQLKAAPDSLPIADCTPEPTPVDTALPTSLEPPSEQPSAGPTDSISPSLAPTIQPTRSALPTPSKTPAPTKTPKPSPTAPTGPKLSAFTLNPYPREDLVVEDPPGSGQYPMYAIGCSDGYWTVGIYIEAQDPDGIASVTLYYQPEGVSTPIEEPMGEEGPGEYYREIVTDYEHWETGEIDYWITATDGVGDSTTFNGPSNKTLVFAYCND
jgi:hypothetical protein